MHSYIDLYFSPEGVPPLEISNRLRRAVGLAFIVGPHDLAFEWQTEADFHEKIGQIHEALKGTGVFYRVETVTDEPAFVEPVPWPSLPRSGRVHPAY